MDPVAFAYLGAGIGAGLVTIGAGIGIGNLAAKAREGLARQPQAAGEIRTSMIVVTVFIEGVALFGEAICILLAFK